MLALSAIVVKPIRKHVKDKHHWRRVLYFISLVMSVRNYGKDVLMRASVYRAISDAVLHQSLIEFYKDYANCTTVNEFL